jgi:hypothetical protein
MNDSYTDEELAALPQTNQVFDAPEVNLDEHQLVQSGYMVTDVCHSTSFSIPSGKTLVRKDGKYSFVNEL